MMIRYDSLWCTIFPRATVVPMLNRYTLPIHFVNWGLPLPGQFYFLYFLPKLSSQKIMSTSTYEWNLRSLVGSAGEKWICITNVSVQELYLAGSWNYFYFMAKALWEKYSQTTFQNVWEAVEIAKHWVRFNTTACSGKVEVFCSNCPEKSHSGHKHGTLWRCKVPSPSGFV